MKRNILLWSLTALVLMIIPSTQILPEGMGFLAVSVALILDLWAVRSTLLQLRMRLDQRGLELGQIIPSTLVIFIWLMYAVVHFQIFISIVNFLNLPPAALKWVFPMTAFKSLWLVYYLGSKLPEKMKNTNPLHLLICQIPWAFGGTFVWWYSCIESSIYTYLFLAIILSTQISPSLISLINARSLKSP